MKTVQQMFQFVSKNVMQIDIGVRYFLCAMKITVRDYT